jgi:hypothetical protein
MEPIVPVAYAGDGFLYKQLLYWLQKPGSFFPVLYPILAYLLLFIQAVTLNGLINEQRLLPSANFLIAFAYLLLTSLVPEWNTLSTGIIINTIMVAILPSMINLYHNQKVKGLLFNIGFGFGICSFIYFPSIYFILLLILALALYRPVQITEWLVTFIGLLTPFYFLLVYFFVWDQWHQVHEIIPKHVIGVPKGYQEWQFWLMISLLLLPALLGYVVSSRYRLRLVVQGRKNWMLITYYFFIAFFISFINNNGNIGYFILVAVPLSIYTAALYSLPTRKTILETIIWLSFAYIVWSYLF